MNIEEIEARVKELEERKTKLINNIKKNYARIRYKKYEEKALLPLLKQSENVRIDPLRKQLRVIEFKIATQAYTSKIEKELIKEVMKIEEKLGSVRHIEKARRKKRYIDRDISDCDEDIKRIEEKLKVIRTELKGLYPKVKSAREGKKHGIIFGEKPDTFVSLEDIAIIEDKTKKK